MIIDNQNQNLKVHEWIDQNISNGSFDIVTGYFTIGALAFLSDKTNEKISEYRLIIGDIVSSGDQNIKSIDLLNENLSVDGALGLSKWAREAVTFLKQNKVECKTLEPNFCHAKLYLSKSANNNAMQETYIMGSSNLTEAGIGLIQNKNVELNVAGTGTESTYRELREWFNDLWNKPQAHLTKTLKTQEGKDQKVNFKQYLIDEISRLFKVYTPLDIYNKILYSLFQREDDSEFQKEIGKLESTQIYRKLFPFQQVGVINLIKILNKYDGAILADAVGLGKTWSTLAVIKYFQNKGRETILLCPKKLEQNWMQFKKRQNSIFENDNFDYEIRFHTDFSEKMIEKSKFNLDYITNDKPKLFVIDESHNLRKDKSARYKVLVDEILKKAKGDCKVLLLSATPINNNFKDVRNQFALMTRGNNQGFSESLDVRNLEYTFKKVQKIFNEWNTRGDETLSDFYKNIHSSDFFKLTEHLVISRTRKHIRSHFDSHLHFPTVLKPKNIYKTPLQLGDFDDLPDLMEKLNLNLSAYQPSQFTLTIEELEAKQNEKKNKGVKDAILKDDLQREFFLVRMMKILMLKRLESSWLAFRNTINNIYNHHENALKKIKEFQELRKESDLENINFGMDEGDDDIFMKIENIELGKKNPIKLAEIERAGRLDDFKDAIRHDKEKLLIIKKNVADFEADFNKNQSKDIKLKELLNIIDAKQLKDNKKLVIFTAYADTARYLFDVISNLEHNAGLVFGDNAYIYSTEQSTEIQTLLMHFAPYTKLFLEKQWTDFHADKILENYGLWKEYIQSHHENIHQIVEKPVDILITTDVLSEGQNLQDADMVINYDVHWNPVRVIQRFGRVDRIGSPNETIECINFWPAKSINDYINLKKRVETRMAVMQFIGSEVIKDFTDDFAQMAENPLEQKQNEHLLKQMEGKIEDLDGEHSLGFDDFSFDIYKQQLYDTIQSKSKEMLDLPNGIFSGFEVKSKGDLPQGIIVLLGLKPKKDNGYASHHLVYLKDDDGLPYSDNMKVVLEIINQYKNEDRIVPKKVETGESPSLLLWQSHIEKWIESQHTEYTADEDGNIKSIAGKADLDLLNAIKGGSKSAINQIKENGTASDRYRKENFDVITWLIVSKS